MNEDVSPFVHQPIRRRSTEALASSGDKNWPFAHAVDWMVQFMKPRIRFGAEAIAKACTPFWTSPCAVTQGGAKVGRKTPPHGLKCQIHPNPATPARLVSHQPTDWRTASRLQHHKICREGQQASHRMRRSPVPKHSRLLGKRRRHLHDRRARMHARLPFLCRWHHQATATS